jgi:Xaa-Pro aminopeptidase
MRVAGLSRLAFEGSNLTHNEYIKLAEIPGLVLENEDIDDMREIKDVEEIASIQKACNISDSVFEKTLTIIKHGITEKEVAMFMESEIKKQGGELAFPTIVAFGPNAATPHHNTDETQLMENQFILFDFGAKYHEYCSDLSRTIYFGTPSEQEIAYYNAVKTSQEKAIDYARTASPVIGGQIEEQARNYLRSLNLEPFMHSGHGMGLYDHELPSIRPASQEIITENMVFTIEPGFYISGQLGIRIEDDIVKTKDGIEILTHAPKELIIKA